MAHLPTTEERKMIPRCNELTRHGSSQTNAEDFPLRNKKPNASNQIIDEDLLRKESFQQTIGKDSTTQTNEGDFSLPLLGNVRTQKPEVSVSRKINYKGNDCAATSISPEGNRKRNVTSDQMTVHTKVSPKQSRLESEEVIGTIREKSRLKPDMQMGTSAKSALIAIKKRHLKALKFRTNSLPNSHIQEIQAVDSLDSRIPNTEQATASNFSIYQEENKSNKESHESKEKVPFSNDDILAIPGPSRPRENILQKNLPPQKISPHKKPTMAPTEDTPMCVACKKETIPNHRKPHEGKFLYSCCQCKYKSKSEEYLRQHILNHPTKPFYCEECDLHFSERGLHDDGQKCDVCPEDFKCKYKLEIHYLLHEEFHKDHCILCKEKFKTHRPECCVCENKYIDLYSHVFTYSPLTIYKCDICGHGLKSKAILSNHKTIHHPQCKKCKGERFLSRSFFDEHCSTKHRET